MGSSYFLYERFCANKHVFAWSCIIFACLIATVIGCVIQYPKSGNLHYGLFHLLHYAQINYNTTVKLIFKPGARRLQAGARLVS